MLPAAADELRARGKSYDRERSIVAAIGYAPFLLIYLLVHTRYLRPYVPEGKGAAVMMLIVLPATWFAAVMLLHGWLGPKRRGLACPRCGLPLVGRALKDMLETSTCARCGTRVVS